MSDKGVSGSESSQPGMNLSARWPSFGQPLELVTSQIPKPEPGEVLIRIAYCGVCGSEIHFLNDPRESPGTVGVFKDLVASNLGFLGHEYSGVIESVGPDVRGWQVSAPVVGLARLPCGSCARCLAADPLNCTAQWRPENKAYARYMTVRAAQLRAVPPDLDLRLAALATPLAECLHALDAAEWRPGLNALVVGVGSMGLLTTALLLHAGAEFVIVSEPNQERRDLSATIGAVAVSPESALETVSRMTGGNGIDVAFESVGSIKAFETSMSALRQGGRLVQIGLAPYGDQYSLDLRQFWHRRISVVVGGAPETTIDRALSLLPKLGAERFIGGEFSLGHVNEAFATAAGGRAGKVLVAPWAADGTDPGTQ
jgi:(R,R)-butanediol dehydrogenase/meso-butanediol dehydrogenase/diacetyl reductase